MVGAGVYCVAKAKPILLQKWCSVSSYHTSCFFFFFFRLISMLNEFSPKMVHCKPSALTTELISAILEPNINTKSRGINKHPIGCAIVSPFKVFTSIIGYSHTFKCLHTVVHVAYATHISPITTMVSDIRHLSHL